ncbi:cysteine desulfurase [Clostridia bacterium]|nr:cysteine desulfurase [Clostridia bacterium]
MEVYFDNAATTRCSEAVVKCMEQVFRKEYANPSSLHKKGFLAEQQIRTAREQIAKTLKAKEQEIFFVSGGTESDNLAILGAAAANNRRGKHLITSKIEHPAVRESFLSLESKGFSVTYLEVDAHGQIDIRKLQEAITAETILVSLLYVNNEIGTISPIAQAGKLIKETNPNTLFHTDAVQAYGKYRISPGAEHIDLLSASAHKIHGPKGVGFLYVKEKTKITPLLFGGGQQKGLRPGTENTSGIVGLAKAAEEAYQHLEEDGGGVSLLREAFVTGLQDVDWAFVNGYGNDRELVHGNGIANGSDRENINVSVKATDTKFAPHILSISFEGVKSEVLLHALEDKGIYVSSGSACSSNKPAVSETLKAIGLKQQYHDTTLRFSFSKYNTLEEVEYTVATLKELVPVLQKYTRH